MFKNPIPPPAELKADPHISGTWFGANDRSSKEQLLIFPRSSGWIDVVYISNIDGNAVIDGPGINVVVFEGYSTSVNKPKYLCLRLREKDFKERPRAVEDSYFLIVNYETPSNGQLVMKPFSQEKVKELIEKGTLEGEIVKGTYVDKVTVTSSSDKLVELISNEGDGAFTEQDPNDVLVFSRDKT